MNYSHTLIACFFLILTINQHYESSATTSVDPDQNELVNNNRKFNPPRSRIGNGTLERTAVAVYRDQNNSLFQIILSDLFGDINWQAISEARQQVEKFIRRLERIWTYFGSSSNSQQQQNPLGSLFGANSNQREAELGASGPGAQTRRETSSSGRQPFIAKLFGFPSTSPSSASSKFPPDDQTNIKAMLERVACFVGYMRLLTHSHAALADLDASKVVSNLFAADKQHSNNSLLSNLFG